MSKNTPTRSKIIKINYKFFIDHLVHSLYEKEQKLIAPRSVRISNLYDSGVVYIPQGRVMVRYPLRPQLVGLRFGVFAATKKPFNFRPKVKKKKR